MRKYFAIMLNPLLKAMQIQTIWLWTMQADYYDNFMIDVYLLYGCNSEALERVLRDIGKEAKLLKGYGIT